MTDDWWQKLLDERKQDGCHGAEAGIFDPPYPGSNDPQEEDENRAYKRGFDARRKELGERFRWR